MHAASGKSVRVEITEETVVRLLLEGRVCAADFRCLDIRSKQCLRRLCLESCIGRTMIGDGSARNLFRRVSASRLKAESGEDGEER